MPSALWRSVFNGRSRTKSRYASIEWHRPLGHTYQNRLRSRSPLKYACVGTEWWGPCDRPNDHGTYGFGSNPNGFACLCPGSPKKPGPPWLKWGSGARKTYLSPYTVHPNLRKRG